MRLGLPNVDVACSRTSTRAGMRYTAIIPTSLSFLSTTLYVTPLIKHVADGSDDENQRNAYRLFVTVTILNSDPTCISK